MRNIFAFLFTLVITFASSQEDDGNIKLTRQGFGTSNGVNLPVGWVNPKGITEGTPYYFEDWNTVGLIYTKEKGRLKMEGVNINLFENTLEALYKDNNVFAFDNKNILRITINKHVFRIFTIDKKDKILEQFFKGSFSVYKYQKVSYVKKNTDPMTTQRFNKYVKKDRYYLYQNDKLTQIKLTKKAFSKMFKSNNLSQESILNYMADNKLSLKDEKDLITILKYVSQE